MINGKNLFTHLLFLTLLFFTIKTSAASIDEFKRLQKAYPNHIQFISNRYISLRDGTRLPIRGVFPLFDRLIGMLNHVDHTLGSISKESIRRDGYHPLFKKMYGRSEGEVKKNLTTIYWMPNIFGTRYPLRVTTINGIDQKLRHISAALEKLPPEYYKYLASPAGGFYWRNVAGESYLSSHSFGIAVDINSNYSNYWLWDLQKEKRSIHDYSYHNRNRIPLRIVEIFENEGFLWGGRWYFYDTMHFEYRPDLFITS